MIQETVNLVESSGKGLGIRPLEQRRVTRRKGLLSEVKDDQSANTILLISFNHAEGILWSGHDRRCCLGMQRGVISHGSRNAYLSLAIKLWAIDSVTIIDFDSLRYQ
jgi:hypothetical protein